MSDEQGPETQGTKTIVATAVIGVILVAAAGLLGKKDWLIEVVYDLGIACLIIAGIEVGLQRGLSKMPGVLRVVGEHMADFNALEGYLDKKEDLEDIATDLFTSQQDKQEAREKLALLEAERERYLRRRAEQRKKAH